MAEESDQRSALMEIPEPQAKIAGRLRRSYMDILCSRLSAGAKHRTHGCGVTHRHTGDAGSGRRGTAGDVDACQTNVSKQLLNSLLLAEQSVQMESGALSSDLRLLLEDLHQKKSSVYRSIPYSRLASNRDAHCYRKAQPHLMAFKRSCQDGGCVLLRDAQWEKLLEFVLSACRYTSELPQWETSAHNALREHCYNTLAAFCSTALQKHRPPARRARALLRRFKVAAVSKRTISPCVEELQKILQDYQAADTHTQMECDLDPSTHVLTRHSCDRSH